MNCFTFLYFPIFAVCLSVCSILEKVSWAAMKKKKCALQCLDGMFCRCLLGPFDLLCHLIPIFLFYYLPCIDRMDKSEPQSHGLLNKIPNAGLGY